MLIQNGVGYTDYLDNEDLDQEFVDLQLSSIKSRVSRIKSYNSCCNPSHFLHLNVKKIQKTISGESEQRIFFWRIGCPCLQLDGLVPSVDWVESHSTFNVKFISAQKSYDSEIQKLNERSNLNNHTKTLFFLQDDQARRLVFRIFLPCGPTRCRLLCKSWGFSVGKWSNTSHWDFHTCCMGWVPPKWRHFKERTAA